MEIYNPWGRSGAGAPNKQAPNALQRQETGNAPPQGSPRTNNEFGGYPPTFQKEEDFFAALTGSKVGSVGIGGPMPMIDGPSVSERNCDSSTAKSFARGRVNSDQVPAWQKEEALKKQRAQQEIQDALRKQILEREAVKAKEEQRRKEEERMEMERIRLEQEEIKQRFKIEQEEAKKREVRAMYSTR
ncbi:hypothetical protein HDU67_009003 [Dinochytrium kinnereticum]|nr:hypothetical protein HDU67_009003 [Dinochytrium kinnereticum]